MSLPCSKLSDGSISLRENARIFAVSYIIHPYFLFPPPTCLTSSSSTPVITHFAAVTLVPLLYFKHGGHISVWCTVPNVCNISIFSNVTFSMRHSLITGQFHTISHTSKATTSILYFSPSHCSHLTNSVHFNYLNHPTKSNFHESTYFYLLCSLWFL